LTVACSGATPARAASLEPLLNFHDMQKKTCLSRPSDPAKLGRMLIRSVTLALGFCVGGSVWRVMRLNVTPPALVTAVAGKNTELSAVQAEINLMAEITRGGGGGSIRIYD
jgi:hypothetical protein